jgi:hypothetical protein
MGKWASDVWAGTVGGTISGVVSAAVVLLLASTVFSNRIAEVALTANPTCDNPRGLKPIPRGELLPPTGTDLPGVPGATSYKPMEATDGFGGTIWIPKLAPSDAKHPVPEFVPGEQSQLTIPLTSVHDIKLVCVVNGLANAYNNYENWGRVRTVKTWGDELQNKQTAVLQSLGADNFPNAQFAGRDLGPTSRVVIELVDAYAGLTEESHDPDVCVKKGWKPSPSLTPQDNAQLEFEQGCLISAVPWAGLSEVYLYESAT